MMDTNTIIIILVILALVFYFLFYPSIKEGFGGGSNDKLSEVQMQLMQLQQQLAMQQPMQPMQQQVQQPMDPMIMMQQQPPINVNVATGEDDPFTDYIKKTDNYGMYDVLTYPQQRMSREVIELYKQYYEKNGTYPPFNMASRGYLFDNPIPVGYLHRDDRGGGCGDGYCGREGYDGNDRGGRDRSRDSEGGRFNNEGMINQEAPYTLPIFRVKSAKNNNRYFYYTIDQKYYGKYQTKIPFQNVLLNGVPFKNADEHGIPEIFDHDRVEIMNIYPGIPYKATIYKQNHFP